MRASLIVTVSALALLATPALGQSTTPGGAARSPSSSNAPSAQPAPKPDPLKQQDVSQIKGAAVYGSDSQKIGSVSTVLMKPDSKQIDRLVVAAGGVLGVGARNVAVPIDQFKWDAGRGGFVIAKRADELKSMPEWQAPSAASSNTGATSSGSSTPPSRPASGSATGH